MDGQDGGQRTKPDGNRNPKRGSIIKTIIADWTGGGGGGTATASAGGGGGGGKDNTGNGGGS
ncbi:glycine-rich selenoprotein-like [Hordeum vulgare subsp. vulgare]|uniref:glycine-rich selenoprotein-like n=1 Tax=Hordeum vulgare subsp. vulgare TaxID=112509 RepID=UPI001D1A4CD8|nr:glycine-rich selenoprotein-like [Hordeum vulgare subsp. vulgare]